MRMDDLNQEVDDLLEDLHKIIDEKDEAEPAEEELPDLTPYLGEDFDEEAAALKVEDMPDLTPYLGEAFEEKQPEPAAEPQPKSHWTQTQKLPRHVAKLQRNQEQAYADWLYEQGHGNAYTPPPMEEEVPAEEPKKKKKQKKKRHILRNIVLTLLLLALLTLAAVIFLLPSQPVALSGMGQRRDGVSTILLAGTDAGGARTDALILLTLDQEKDRATLVSIPRDTLVNTNWSVKKINAAYSRGGIDGLKKEISKIMGFVPDSYAVINLQAFEELVDAIGGVYYDVPVDMHYDDPTQDLSIHVNNQHFP